MINTTLYTPERICSDPETIKFPLKLFCEIGVSVPNLVVTNGLLFCPHDSDNLVAYNEEDGSTLWVSKFNDLMIGLQLIIGEKLLVADLYTDKSFLLSMHDGALLGELGSIKGFNWEMKGNNIYAVRFNKEDEFKIQLSCLSPKDISEKWVYKGLQFDHYAASDDYILLKDNKGNLVGLDTNGQELWRLAPIDTGLFSSQSEIDNIPERTPEFVHLNQTLGYPMIYQNRIGVVPMLDHHLMGIDLATGKVLWTRRVENTISSLRQGYCDEVYCLGNSFIEAFSMETGEQTKKVAIDGSYIQESLGLETVSFTQFAVSGTHIFTASHNMHYLTAIEIKTGKVVWTFQPEVAVTASDQPYVANGRVYFPCLCKMYIFEGKDGYALAE